MSLLKFNDFKDSLLEFVLNNKDLKLGIGDEKLILATGKTEDGRHLLSPSLTDEGRITLVLFRTGKKGFFSGKSYLVGFFRKSKEEIEKQMKIGETFKVSDDNDDHYTGEVLGIYEGTLDNLKKIADKSKEKILPYAI